MHISGSEHFFDDNSSHSVTSGISKVFSCYLLLNYTLCVANLPCNCCISLLFNMRFNREKKPFS